MEIRSRSMSAPAQVETTPVTQPQVEVKQAKSAGRSWTSGIKGWANTTPKKTGPPAQSAILGTARAPTQTTQRKTSFTQNLGSRLRSLSNKIGNRRVQSAPGKIETTTPRSEKPRIAMGLKNLQGVKQLDRTLFGRMNDADLAKTGAVKVMNNQGFPVFYSKNQLADKALEKLNGGALEKPSQQDRQLALGWLMAKLGPSPTEEKLSEALGKMGSLPPTNNGWGTQGSPKDFYKQEVSIREFDDRKAQGIKMGTSRLMSPADYQDLTNRGIKGAVDVPGVPGKVSFQAHRDFKSLILYSGVDLKAVADHNATKPLAPGKDAGQAGGDAKIKAVYDDLMSKMEDTKGTRAEKQMAAHLGLTAMCQTFEAEGSGYMHRMAKENGFLDAKQAGTPREVTTHVQDGILVVSVKMDYQMMQMADDGDILMTGRVSHTRTVHIDIASGEVKSAGETYGIIPTPDQ